MWCDASLAFFKLTSDVEITQCYVCDYLVAIAIDGPVDQDVVRLDVFPNPSVLKLSIGQRECHTSVSPIHSMEFLNCLSNPSHDLHSFVW